MASFKKNSRNELFLRRVTQEPVELSAAWGRQEAPACREVGLSRVGNSHQRLAEEQPHSPAEGSKRGGAGKDCAQVFEGPGCLDAADGWGYTRNVLAHAFSLGSGCSRIELVNFSLLFVPQILHKVRETFWEKGYPELPPPLIEVQGH